MEINVKVIKKERYLLEVKNYLKRVKGCNS